MPRALWNNTEIAASDDTVVIDEAVFPQHDAVAATARIELLPGIGVEKFHEGGGVRPGPQHRVRFEQAQLDRALDGLVPG